MELMEWGRWKWRAGFEDLKWVFGLFLLPKLLSPEALLLLFQKKLYFGKNSSQKCILPAAEGFLLSGATSLSTRLPLAPSSELLSHSDQSSQHEAPESSHLHLRAPEAALLHLRELLPPHVLFILVFKASTSLWCLSSEPSPWAAQWDHGLHMSDTLHLSALHGPADLLLFISQEFFDPHDLLLPFVCQGLQLSSPLPAAPFHSSGSLLQFEREPLFDALIWQIKATWLTEKQVFYIGE